MPDSTNKGGRKPRVTDGDLLDVFRATADPVLSTAEVADAVPIKRRGTLNRLRDLEDAGTLDSKQIGGRNTVWWLAEDVGRPRPTPDQSPANSDAVDGAEVRGSVDTSLADDRDAEDAILAAVRELDLEGDGTVLKAREQALAEIVRTLCEEGSATAGELKDLVDADAVGYESADNFWSNMRRQNVFDSLPVETPGRGGRTYTYADPSDGGIYDPTEEFDQ